MDDLEDGGRDLRCTIAKFTRNDRVNGLTGCADARPAGSPGESVKYICFCGALGDPVPPLPPQEEGNEQKEAPGAADVNPAADSAPQDEGNGQGVQSESESNENDSLNDS